MRTKKEAAFVFTVIVGEYELEHMKKHDKPKLRQAWNDFVDSLEKDGEITSHQASIWVNPFLQAPRYDVWLHAVDGSSKLAKGVTYEKAREATRQFSSHADAEMGASGTSGCTTYGDVLELQER